MFFLLYFILIIFSHVTMYSHLFPYLTSTTTWWNHVIELLITDNDIALKKDSIFDVFTLSRRHHGKFIQINKKHILLIFEWHIIYKIPFVPYIVLPNWNIHNIQIILKRLVWLMQWTQHSHWFENIFSFLKGTFLLWSG